MGDEGAFWRDVKAAQKGRRELLGAACPECRRLLPKASPTILLPGQRCRIDGYRDPRAHEETPRAERPRAPRGSLG